MTHSLLDNLTRQLDTQASRAANDRKYLKGRQALAFIPPADRKSIKLDRICSNIPAVQINAISERLRVTALEVDGDANALQAEWTRNDLDQVLPLAFKEALGTGSAYAIVWDKTGTHRPQVSVESSDQVTVHRDPITRHVTAAVKRVDMGGGDHRAWFYLPDRVECYTAKAPAGGWNLAQIVPNPLGVVPVVEFANADTINGGGVSEIENLKPLVDALNKILSDLMVASEWYARPRRWATGIQMPEDEDGNPVNPFGEGDRMMISEEVEAKFGSLPAADMGGYEAAVKVILAQIEANSALPSHYLGNLTGQTPGADGLRASEAALTARAEAKQRLFGRAVEQVGRLMWAIMREVEVDEATVKVRWSDAGTRSIAQEADAVVKLHEAGLLPADYALARLGYDADEIAAIRKVRLVEQATKIAQAAA